MSYDIHLRAKVEGIDEYVDVAYGNNITWNVHELIKKSSGWKIKNEANDGLAEDIGYKCSVGIKELETNPKKYKRYESQNGWGTIPDTINFFQELLKVCKEYPYAYVFVD